MICFILNYLCAGIVHLSAGAHEGENRGMNTPGRAIGR